VGKVSVVSRAGLDLMAKRKSLSLQYSPLPVSIGRSFANRVCNSAELGVTKFSLRVKACCIAERQILWGVDMLAKIYISHFIAYVDVVYVFNKT
jgi:hypothetical protein